MQQWQRRPIEVANLLNPAFCGISIGLAVRAYSASADRGLSFGMAFLVLPIILHEQTRIALPRDTRTPLLAWIETNQAALINFPYRVRKLLPVTREALHFALTNAIIDVDGDGDLVAGRTRISTRASSLRALTQEAEDSLRRSSFLGRWFASAGTPATVMASWGVAP